MQKKHAIVSLVALLGALVSTAASAHDIYFTQAHIPARLTEQGLKGFMRGHHSKNINEENDHKTWKFNLGVFLSRPADDIELHILFYDVEHGREDFVSDMSVFLSDRSENTFLQPVKLERPMFKPMNNYMAALQIKRQRLAKKDFQLVGQRDERSGQVSFSDAETVDPEEAAAQQHAREEAARRQQEEAQVSELEAREQLQAQADAQAQAEAAESGDGNDEPVGHFDEYGEIPQSDSPGSESGGCASCRVGGPAPPGGALAALLAIPILRRRRR